jgi:hypothetical protein
MQTIMGKPPDDALERLSDEALVIVPLGLQQLDRVILSASALKGSFDRRDHALVLQPAGQKCKLAYPYQP